MGDLDDEQVHWLSQIVWRLWAIMRTEENAQANGGVKALAELKRASITRCINAAGPTKDCCSLSSIIQENSLVLEDSLCKVCKKRMAAMSNAARSNFWQSSGTARI
ncbi:hypothetical protein AB2I57_26095 (plasmid) [Escherichia coli]